MNYPNLTNFRTEQDDRGVLTVVFDVPGRSHNVFDEEVVAELEDLVGALQHDPGARLVVFTSGKESGFFAGADVRRIRSVEMPAEAKWMIVSGQRLLERIERLPMPTVAVIHGPCLGGGLEFALACRYRLARDDRQTQLGLPEVQLGLLPAWGGTQRLPNTVGLAAALEMILSGRKVSAGEAAELGLVDLASVPDRFDADVRQFVSDRLQGIRRTPRREGLFKRLRDRTRWGQRFVLRTARRRIAARAGHYPALAAAIDTVERGLAGSHQQGLTAERDAFADLLFTPACRNLIELYFQRQRARKRSTWMEDQRTKPLPVRRLAVWGAGTMGAGIAQTAAYHGLDVLLYDVDDEALETGMEKIRKLMSDSVGRRLLRADEAAARLGAVVPCLEWVPLDDVDLVVEAVPEREDLKRELFRRWDQRLPSQAVLTSNTSALSIGRLAKATRRSDRVAGLHFFNPVYRMPLVEVVRTADTSEKTLGTLLDLVRRLGKTPLVVADTPGFLVNRILFPYLDEAVRMVGEGIATAEIDRRARRFGVPLGPLELLDLIGIDVAADVARSLLPLAADPSPTLARLAEMVRVGRMGKKSGVGFYYYRNGKPTKPVAAGGRKRTPNGPVRSAAFARGTMPARDRLRDSARQHVAPRLIHVLINEAARCLEDRVVAEAWMVDLGAVLGIGFPPFRGGPLRLADDCGLSQTVGDLEDLQRTHGNRFAPCALLVEMSEQGKVFYPDPAERIEPAIARTPSHAKAT